MPMKRPARRHEIKCFGIQIFVFPSPSYFRKGNCSTNVWVSMRFRSTATSWVVPVSVVDGDLGAVRMHDGDTQKPVGNVELRRGAVKGPGSPDPIDAGTPNQEGTPRSIGAGLIAVDDRLDLRYCGMPQSGDCAVWAGCFAFCNRVVLR